MASGLNHRVILRDNNMESKKKNSIKDYFQVGEALGYFFRKKDPSRPKNFNIKVMHGVNKISIIIFLLGVIYLIVKRLF